MFTFMTEILHIFKILRLKNNVSVAMSASVFRCNGEGEESSLVSRLKRLKRASLNSGEYLVSNVYFCTLSKISVTIMNVNNVQLLK
jgi:hypothetical protein